MKVFAPGYYHTFSCLASDCPDSCCKDWIIDIDDDSAAFYRALPGSLGDALRGVLQSSNGSTVMAITDGHCPMWQQDGLCRIQAQLGHEALCRTCRDFPRLRHDYGDFVELGLELSCPEAARRILSDDDPTWIVETVPGGEPKDYDPDIMDILRTSRETILRFLRPTARPFPHALAVILAYANRVQAQIDGGDVAAFDLGLLSEEAARCAGTGDMALLFSFFRGLEILTPRWKARLEGAAQSAPWSDAFFLLARYFIARYYLQAVADFELVGRVKLAVAACLLVHALGGDLVQTAQMFSKEIENDPDNVDAILSGAYTSPALSDENLFGLLLGKSRKNP